MSSFPLRGVIGIVANTVHELDLAVGKGLHCVEIRADLLLENGLSLDEVMKVVREAKRRRLASLFTLRHPSHGGKFDGDESERVSMNRQALAAGADIVDLEWDSEAATRLLSDNAPMLLSYHDFSAMPDEAALTNLTEHMTDRRPLAIKVVPTATTLADSARMLRWVEEGARDVARVGFSMGAEGACSRILTIAYGAPITYASFGAPVAPGQVAIDDLLDVYRAIDLNGGTRVVAVLDGSAAVVNQRLQAENQNRIAIPFAPQQLEELNALRDALRIDDIRA